jgi:hypothetical protein
MVFRRAWDELFIYQLFRSRALLPLRIACVNKAFKMTTKIPVLTDKAPKPLPGIYSQAIIANGVVYCSGAVPMDATTGKLIDGDVKAHTVSIKSKPS